LSIQTRSDSSSGRTVCILVAAQILGGAVIGVARSSTSEELQLSM